MHKTSRLEWFLILFVALMGILAHERNYTWRDELSLWDDVAVKSPQKVAPHLNLGNALVRRGALDAAAREFERALEINPLDSRVINSLAVIAFRQERYDEAIRLLQVLVEDKPDEPYFQNNLGALYMKKGALGKAEVHLRTAIQLRPDYAEAYNNLGLVCRGQDRLREAAAAFSKVLELNPNHTDARKNLSELQVSDGEAQ